MTKNLECYYVIHWVKDDLKEVSTHTPLDDDFRIRSYTRHVSEYLSAGFSVESVETLDKESFFNYRLERAVSDYRKVLKYHEEMSATEKEYDYEPLKMLEEQIEACERTIVKRVARMIRHDLDVNNDLAMEMFNHSDKYNERGLKVC